MAQRPLFVWFLVGASLTTFLLGIALALATTADGGFEAAIILHPMLVLVGLLVLIGAVIRSPSTRPVREACVQCGARIYQTKRAEDNGLVWSCFTCGWESPAARVLPVPRQVRRGGPQHHL